MKSSRLLDRRAGFSFASIMLLLAMVAPSFLPMFASAAQVTSRSIKMSNSAASTAAQYTVTFTTPTGIPTGGGVNVEFCSNSPIQGDSCTAPAGFAISSPTITGGNGATATAPTSNVLKLANTTSATAAAGTFTVAVTGGITNPNNTVTTFYGRIYTFTTNGNQTGFTGGATTGTPADFGGIALSVTNTVAVKAVVLETLQFCLSAAAPAAGCTSTTTPSLTLGHGSPLALDATAVDNATAYAQISTNASSGAIVNATTDNSCGGLHRIGAAAGTCEIPAANAGAATAAAYTLGTGGFGFQAQASAGTGTNFGSTTTLAPYNGTGTGNTGTYGFYTTNLTSTYGDTVFNTAGAPIANRNVPLYFGASAANNSPAGTYTANMNFVATGTF